MARHGVEDLIRSKISRIRHWKLTSLGKKRPRWDSFEFTVMSYNILGQSAVDSHMYLYSKCNPPYLSEEYRISRILPEILKSKSDVVCLQEVEHSLFDQRIKKVFDSNGFGSIYKKRTGNKTDGCAIFWRRAKFNLLRHQEVEFKAKGSEYLNRDNVGLIAVLKPRHPHASNTQLHVATTHLIFNPRRGDVKLCQLRLLLAELERSAFRTIGEKGRKYHPTILCGDFNFEPHSPLYEFVEKGRLDVSGLVAGNMSGQHEGKDKGGQMFGDRLSLDKLGVDESGRFCENASSELSDKATATKTTNRTSSSSSYRLLAEKLHEARVKSKAASFRSSQMVSEAQQHDVESDSSSSSESEDNTQIFYHDFNFVPAYRYYQKDRRSYPVTSMTGSEFNTVDHIFYNVKQKSSTSHVEDRLKLLGTYCLPQAEDLKEMGGLPNAHLGSDHVSLMSKFMITFKR